MYQIGRKKTRHYDNRDETGELQNELHYSNPLEAHQQAKEAQCIDQIDTTVNPYVTSNNVFLYKKGDTWYEG